MCRITTVIVIVTLLLRYLVLDTFHVELRSVLCIMSLCDIVIIVINANCFIVFSPGSMLRAVAEQPKRTERYTIEVQRFTQLCALQLCHISTLIFHANYRKMLHYVKTLIRIVSLSTKL